MKIIEKVTVYKCEYCVKKLFRKHSMVNHEKWCPANPKNQQACEYCNHLEVIETFYNIQTAVDDYKSIPTKGFKCNKLNKMVYPLKVQRLRLPEKYPEQFEDQIPMPKICEHMNDDYLI